MLCGQRIFRPNNKEDQHTCMTAVWHRRTEFSRWKVISSFGIVLFQISRHRKVWKLIDVALESTAVIICFIFDIVA